MTMSNKAATIVYYIGLPHLSALEMLSIYANPHTMPALLPDDPGSNITALQLPNAFANLRILGLTIGSIVRSAAL